MISKDLKNIKTSSYCIADYIKNRPLKSNRKEDIPNLVGFGQAAWTFISTIYDSSWNALKTDDNNKLFCSKVFKQFGKKITITISNKKSEKILIPRVEFSNLLLLLVPPRLSKEKLNKLKYHGKNQKIS